MIKYTHDVIEQLHNNIFTDKKYFVHVDNLDKIKKMLTT